MMRRALSTLVAAAALGLAGCAQELVCPSDQLACGGACVAPSTDPSNCGACGARCGPLGVCSAGACQCGPGTVLCGGSCVDLASDPSNCGACGVACPGALVCSSGGGPAACVDVASCTAAGRTSCHRACVDLASNRYHCGACGRACGTGERCAQGLCLAELYATCFNTNEVREATADLLPAGIPVATEAGPLALAWLGNSLFVANSSNNTVDELRFDPPAVRKEQVITIPSSAGFFDLEYIAAHGGLLYVSNAAVGVLDVVDPVAGKVIAEVPLAPSTFPAGIAIVGTKAYVAMNGTSEVAVVDVSRTGTCPPDPGAPPCPAGTCSSDKVCVGGSCQPAFCVAKRIALPAADLASPGGSPMPSRLASVGNLLYVTLWNLKPTDYAPAGSGRLAVIDTTSDALVTTAGSYPIDLGSGCQNPADIAAVGQALYVSCGFFPFNDPTNLQGAAIVKVDLSGGTPVVGPELPLSGHAPGPLAFCGGAGYAGDRNAGSVFRFDPAFDGSLPSAKFLTGTATLCPPPASGGTPYVADLVCAP